MNNIKRYKVYVVDSNSDYRYVCSDNLRRLGIDVVGDSADGMEALQEIARFRPDVVLVDLWLSGLDTHCLISEAMKLDADYHPEFILVTGINNRRLIEDTINVGAAACILKPFEYSSLGFLFRQKLSLYFTAFCKCCL